MQLMAYAIARLRVYSAVFGGNALQIFVIICILGTDLNGVITAIRDWMVSVELDAGQEYFLDPDGQKSQAGQQAQAQQSQQQQQEQSQMQQMQMQLLDMEKKMEDQKLAEDKRQHDTELEFKYWKELLEADQEDAKLEASSSDSAPPASAGNGAGRTN